MNDGPAQRPAPRPIGYLASAYPAVSHTFIRREIAALRRRGLLVETFGIRRPDPASLRNEADRAEAARTSYVLPSSAASVARTHLAALGRRPLRYFELILAALRHRAPGGRSLLWACFYFLEAVMLARLLEARGVRHLHIHFANAGGTVGMLAARLAEIPVSFTVHGAKADFDHPFVLLLPEKVRAAEFVACVSYYGRAQTMRLCPPDQWSKTLVVRCGIELAALPEPTKSGTKSRPRIVCVGRLVPEKAQIGLVEAFATLADQSIDAELVLVGDGEDRPRIEARVRSLRIEDRVVLTGALPEDETLRTIASADVLALSSFVEGLPVVLMEAMALGIPVVAPSISGIPELVEHERTGLSYIAGDWSGLGAALVRLIRDPELRARLGAAGRERVAREYDIDVAVEPLWRRLTDQP